MCINSYEIKRFLNQKLSEWQMELKIIGKQYHLDRGFKSILYVNAFNRKIRYQIVHFFCRNVTLTSWPLNKIYIEKFHRQQKTDLYLLNINLTLIIPFHSCVMCMCVCVQTEMRFWRFNRMLTWFILNIVFYSFT